MPRQFTFYRRDLTTGLGSIAVDVHISDTVHREVQVFGEFPDLSIFILQRQAERLIYWPPTFLWLTSPNKRVWSLGACLYGDVCGDVHMFL